MNCEFSITLPGTTPHPVDLATSALDEVDRIEDLLSAYRDTSELAQVNLHAQSSPVTLSPELSQVLSHAIDLHRLTLGAFDPAAGALSHAWGFFQPPRRVPSPAELEAARAASGAHHLFLHNHRLAFLRPGLQLNLGAYGKGYALDRAARLLGNTPTLLEAGRSSLLALSTPPREPRGWPVSLLDPFHLDRPLARLFLRHRALATSGDAHQFFLQNGHRYGHILDPRSGRPAQSCVSVTVLAPSAALADALSTALYVLGPDASAPLLAAHKDLAALFVLRAGPGRATLRTFGSLDLQLAERLSA